MNKIYKYLFGVLLFITISCQKEYTDQRDSQLNKESLSMVEFTAFVEESAADTKTIYDSDRHIGLWKREDLAGVVASYGSGSFTDKWMREFSIKERNYAGDEFLTTATFAGKLTNKDNQTYTYHVVYPYTAFQFVSDLAKVSSRLEERQYPELKSWDGLCDMLASKPVTVTSSSVSANNLKVQFKRLFGILRLRFGSSITEIYGSEIVETISIESVNATDKLAGDFTIDLTSMETCDPVMSTADGEYFNKVTLDYRGRNATLSTIDAYFILNPGTYSNVIITIKTKNHSLTLPRTNLPICRGCLASATLSWKNDTDTYTLSTPLLPENPDTLRVLTFGHSYVSNCMEYLDDLLNEAGVTNVTFANLYLGNCSLQRYWEHVNNPGNIKGGSDTIDYYKRYSDGSTIITANLQKTIIDALRDEHWDVVVFQTNTEKLGYYDYFAEALKNMIGYVKTTCQTENGKTPVFAWHMFWAYGSQSKFLYDNYYGSQELNYAAHVKAAKEIIRNQDIQLVIPTGTTIQSLRHSKLNNPYSGGDAYEFLMDGKEGMCHLDYMAGQYACACTWFEYFLKPCFNRTVFGNTFMPPTSYEGVPVTYENRETLQNAAILACKNPFEIAHLDTINSADIGISGAIEPVSAQDNGEIDLFNLIDNLTW